MQQENELEEEGIPFPEWNDSKKIAPKRDSLLGCPGASVYRNQKRALKVCKELGKIPVSMAIDTWAVDYVLLDENDKILGIQQVTETAVTNGMDEKVCMKRFRWELCMQEPESRNRFSTRSIS